jgi:hypothetical protein
VPGQLTNNSVQGRDFLFPHHRFRFAIGPHFKTEALDPVSKWSGFQEVRRPDFR